MIYRDKTEPEVWEEEYHKRQENIVYALSGRKHYRKNRRLSTSLTDNRFGSWGWSMIFYTMILYFFYAAIMTDGMNLIPNAFAAAHGWDATVLLSAATPAGLIGLVGGFVFGRLVIKTKPRNMSGFALIITGILYALLGFVPSLHSTL